jgi:hypothetical protein
MTPNEMNAATTGMTQTELGAWMTANRTALIEMAQRMRDPGTLENQQAMDNSITLDIEWCQSHPDPNIQPGDLRWKWNNKRTARAAVVVVNVIRHPDGRRDYDVLRAARVEKWSAQLLEVDTTP